MLTIPTKLKESFTVAFYVSHEGDLFINTQIEKCFYKQDILRVTTIQSGCN